MHSQTHAPHVTNKYTFFVTEGVQTKHAPCVPCEMQTKHVPSCIFWGAEDASPFHIIWDTVLLNGRKKTAAMLGCALVPVASCKGWLLIAKVIHCTRSRNAAATGACIVPCGTQCYYTMRTSMEVSQSSPAGVHHHHHH